MSGQLHIPNALCTENRPEYPVNMMLSRPSDQTKQSGGGSLLLPVIKHHIFPSYSLLTKKANCKLHFIFYMWGAKPSHWWPSAQEHGISLPFYLSSGSCLAMKAGAEWRDFLALSMELSLVLVCEKFTKGQKINCKMYMIVLVLFAAVKCCWIR